MKLTKSMFASSADYWENEAKRYAGNTDYWREKAQAAERDAERYRWLRAQNWNDGRLAVVADPKDAVKLGHDCPSLARLDEQIDAAMLVWRAVG